MTEKKKYTISRELTDKVKMPDTVLVTKDVAEALEYVRIHFSLADLLSIFDGHSKFPKRYSNLLSEKLNKATALQALINGYEVREPEKELAKYILHNEQIMREQSYLGGPAEYHEGLANGARKAAEILGIQLPEPTEGADAN